MDSTRLEELFLLVALQSTAKGSKDGREHFRTEGSSGSWKGVASWQTEDTCCMLQLLWIACMQTSASGAGWLAQRSGVTSSCRLGVTSSGSRTPS